MNDNDIRRIGYAVLAVCWLGLGLFRLIWNPGISGGGLYTGVFDLCVGVCFGGGVLPKRADGRLGGIARALILCSAAVCVGLGVVGLVQGKLVAGGILLLCSVILCIAAIRGRGI